MATIAELLKLAAALEQANRPAGAEQVYRQILAAAPAQTDALHRLGHILLSGKRPAEAAALLGQAAIMHPADATVHYHLGLAYEALNQWNEALTALARATLLAPAWHEGWNALGLLLKRLGRVNEAIESFRRAAELSPGIFDPLNSLAIALAQTGRLDEARSAFERLVTLYPASGDAHLNLANVLLSQGHLPAACERYAEALRLKPTDPTAQSNLGIALALEGKLGESIAALERATVLAPQSAEAFANLGNSYLRQGRVDRAIESFVRAVQLRPDYLAAASNLLLALNYDPRIDAAALKAQHVDWARRLFPPAPPGPPTRSPAANRRLRIGCISPDFREHPVATFMLPLFRHLDRSRFELLVYADVVQPDAVTHQVQELADVWRPVTGQADAHIARLVQDDAVDVLLDLTGHTANNRLGVFARRPAPVQVAYLGYPATTGLPTITARLTDAVVDPPGFDAHYAERLVRLPRLFCCFTPPQRAGDVGPLPALFAGRVTFGSLNNLPRLNGQVLDLWARLVQSVPGSRLLLFRDALEGSTAEYYAAELSRRGLSQQQFVLKHATTPGQMHLDMYREIDIALDTFPWSGHTTACEALWMGVPVVTLAGQRGAGRMVTSVLEHVGLADWVAADASEYLSIAQRLAADLEPLAARRSGLRQKLAASPLLDGPGFTRAFEDSLLETIAQ